MYRGKTIGVVVPAYNEAGFAGEVIETMPAFVDRVYAVDDASTDGTWGELLDAAARVNGATEARAAATAGRAQSGGVSAAEVDSSAGPRVVTIRHDVNRGVGAAIATGYRRALADGVDVVAVMNGDGQMDPAYLDRILDPVVEGEADYAKGNRLSRSADRRPMPRWRLFGNALLTLLTRVASGYWRLTDPQNGYTAISRRALETIDLDAARDRFGFCNDLLVRLNVNGMRVADVPTPAVYGDEESHIRYRTFVPGLSWLLLRGFARRLHGKYLRERVHPIALLYPLGALGLVVGLVALVAGSLGAVVLAAGLPGVAIASLLGLAGGGALIGGAALLAVAVALDRQTDAHLEVHR